MPVVAVGAVGIIALALLALLVVFAANLLAKLLANLISRIPLGIGDLFSGPVQSMAHAVTNATASAARAVMSPIAGFFQGIALHLTSMWDASATFATELANSMSRLFTHTLPDVIRRAVVQSVDWARGEIRAVEAKVMSAIHTAVGMLDRAVRSVLNRVEHLERTVAADITGIDAKIKAAEASLSSDIAAAEAQAIHTATSLAQGVRADLTNALGVAEVHAAQALTAATQALGNVIDATAADVLSTAEGDISALAGEIDAAASQVATAAWPTITDIVDGIKGASVPVEAVITDAVGSIPQAVPATLADALAATMAIATVGADFVDECGLDLCSNLGGLGGFLSSLGADLAEGALFGLVALMITDPPAGADMAKATLGPIVSGVSGLVTEVIDIGKAVA